MNAELQKALAVLAVAVKQYVEEDQGASFGLPGDVSVVVKSRRVALSVPTDFATTFTTLDGSLSIQWLDPERVKFTAHKFDAEAKLWNGPDVIPNKWFRSMLASLFHDLIWGHAAEIARAMGLTEKAVLRWGNDVLYLLWVWGSEDSWWGRREAWLAFQTCEFSSGWYHKAKKVLHLCLAVAALGLAAAGCSGCYSLPDGGVEGVDGTDLIRAVMQGLGDGL